MWILLLTLTFNTSTGAAASITSVPEFSSQASCDAAAKAWLSSVQQRQASTSAVCVCSHKVCNEPVPLK